MASNVDKQHLELKEICNSNDAKKSEIIVYSCTSKKSNSMDGAAEQSLIKNTSKERSVLQQKKVGVGKSMVPGVGKSSYRNHTNTSDKEIEELKAITGTYGKNNGVNMKNRNKEHKPPNIASVPPLITLPKDKNLLTRDTLPPQQKGRSEQSSVLLRQKAKLNKPDQDNGQLQRQIHVLERPKTWHGIHPERNANVLVAVNIPREIRYVPYDQSKYSYNTSEIGCPYKRPTKPIVLWLTCSEGRVQPGAIVAGREYNNPYTFFGRVTLRNERLEDIFILRM